jgi:predicted Zn-dependent protease
MNFRAIADAVLHESRAGETEVLVLEQDESLTRFANNCIHQNVTERNIQITVRSVIGTKVGIAVSNDPRPDNLRQLTTRALEAARLQPDNPEFKGLPAPQTPSSVSSFDTAVAECAPEERAARVGLICRKAKDVACSAAGSMTTSALSIGVANSKGVFAWHRCTMVDLSTVIMSNDSSGWAQSTGWRLDSVSPESLADEALTKVQRGRNQLPYSRW